MTCSRTRHLAASISRTLRVIVSMVELYRFARGAGKQSPLGPTPTAPGRVGDEAAGEAEVAEGRGAEVGPGQGGAGVDDVGADSHMDGAWDACLGRGQD